METLDGEGIQGFERPTPRSRVVSCNVCGRTGYPGEPWQEACLKDERFPCDKCVLVFHSRQHLNTHRRHHG